ncbi:MAG: lipid hydroperoxide peroxidase [Bdellovibrionales bacterium RIFOXYD1_FULL_53_11]|nr:MAG: lipid hydroperoxide peroxidase [Bdellovibrionales bacterium RIFOXYD1_FULL_53_11]
MAEITFKGNPIHTIGNLPRKGVGAPDFRLVRADLADVSLKDFAGKRKLINIVPSLDTGVCAASARRFNQESAGIPNAVIITVSRDLPFAQKRFCESEGLSAVVTLSEMRGGDFGRDYGVTIMDGPMAGLLGRAVVVLDESDRVVYTEQVPEITREPDYAGALMALKG